MSLRIALHTQTRNSSDGMVAGSEVTTLCLQEALLRHPDVVTVHRIGPEDELPRESLDLVIVEGFHRVVPRVLFEIRRHHPRAKIFYWCLSWLGIDTAPYLGFDGFMTNSRQMHEWLSPYAPTELVLLAADPSRFSPGHTTAKYNHQVTYLGQWRQGYCPLQEMLMLEASAFDLAIYGDCWDRHPYLHPWHRGFLPFDEIASLYCTARYVMATTEPVQRRLGMINNRLFEAVACGARVISEGHPEAQDIFGDAVTFVSGPGELAHAIRTGLPQPADPSVVKEGHTYDHRVPQILDLLARVS